MNSLFLKRIFYTNKKKNHISLIFIRNISKFSNQDLFDKILIANRGEIACRVINTAKKLGIKTVAVFSEADKNAMHIQKADEAFFIGPAPSKDSYLRSDKILEIAKRSGAKAIHPGYGFLSENASFAELCEKEDIVFIGPPASAIRAMGSKSESKNIMSKASVPLIPGYHGEDQSLETLLKEADKIGYPVLIKAVMGGGGKGMRIVEKKQDFESSLLSAKRESMNSFGDDRVLIEKYIIQPRHIEFQIFGDKYGNYVYLFERDCSVQRRHQKIIEEAPAPHMNPELRKKMGEAAVNAARAVGYVGAGTVEFIVDTDFKFYFMEMNTRLQVEHPITEYITKQDLVEWQIKVAANRELPLSQSELKIHGHAFEARIYAENPMNNFLPGTGKLVHLSTPTPSINVRIDTGVREGDEVSVYYDPMIAKLVVWDHDRSSALQRLRLALENYRVIGLPTNISFLGKLASHPEFIAGHVETGFIEKFKKDLLPLPTPISSENLALATLGILLKEKNEQKIKNSISNDPYSPFGIINAKRLNYLHSRTIEFLDGEKKIEIIIKYKQDGSYDIKIPEMKDFINIKGELKNEDMKAFIGDHLISCTIVINDFNLHLFNGSEQYTLKIPVENYNATVVTKGSLLSPMPGRIVQVLVQIGQKVSKGQPLMIMEAMKMEHTIRSPVDGVIEKINYNVNDLVEEKKLLLSIKE